MSRTRYAMPGPAKIHLGTRYHELDAAGKKGQIPEQLKCFLDLIIQFSKQEASVFVSSFFFRVTTKWIRSYWK